MEVKETILKMSIRVFESVVEECVDKWTSDGMREEDQQRVAAFNKDVIDPPSVQGEKMIS